MSENNKDKKAQWGSHLPILSRILDITDGAVLELGTGVWSTALMDLMASETKRKVISYDNDPAWFDANKERWQSDYHDIRLIPEDGWDDINLDEHVWSVAFLDHKPAKRRKVDAQRLAHKALYVLLHDSEPESDKFFKYSWIYKHFKYQYQYTKCRPNTVVLSNFIDLSFLK